MKHVSVSATFQFKCALLRHLRNILLVHPSGGIFYCSLVTCANFFVLCCRRWDCWIIFLLSEVILGQLFHQLQKKKKKKKKMREDGNTENDVLDLLIFIRSWYYFLFKTEWALLYGTQGLLKKITWRNWVFNNWRLDTTVGSLVSRP